MNFTRIPAAPLESLNPAATISGKLLIGSGEFEDNSSLVTLDASFANNVTVMNASLPVTISGGDVEIKNDAGNPIQTAITNTPAVTISGTATVQENLIAANGAGKHASNAGGANTVIVTNAANVNGIIIHTGSASFLTGAGPMGMALLAKHGTTPVAMNDGISLGSAYATASSVGSFEMKNKVKLPAGYCLAFVSSLSGAGFDGMTSGVTYTLL